MLQGPHCGLFRNLSFRQVLPANHQTCNIELPLAPARVQTPMSNKHNLVLYVDQELVEKSRNIGFNLSKTFENHLQDLINMFSTVNSSDNSISTGKNSMWWAEPDLNRRPLARKANVLTKLDDRPTELVYSLSLFFYFLFRYIATWSFSL